MLKKSLLITMSLLLTACDSDEKLEMNRADPKKKEEIFLKCLELAQVQPHTATYNDAAEVVEECRWAAHSIAPSKAEVKNQPAEGGR